MSSVEWRNDRRSCVCSLSRLQDLQRSLKLKKDQRESEPVCTQSRKSCKAAWTGWTTVAILGVYWKWSANRARIVSVEKSELFLVRRQVGQVLTKHCYKTRKIYIFYKIVRQPWLSDYSNSNITACWKRMLIQIVQEFASKLQMRLKQAVSSFKLKLQAHSSFKLHRMTA